MSVFNLLKKSKPAVKRKPSSFAKASADKRVAKVAPAETEVEITPEVVKVFNPFITPVSAILHPYVSEKASRLEGMNQYMFKVTRTANKPEVKKAIQNRYKVTVVAVNMINMPSKKRTVGRHVGIKAGFRKAIVTLAEGQTINASK